MASAGTKRLALIGAAAAVLGAGVYLVLSAFNLFIFFKANFIFANFKAKRRI